MDILWYSGYTLGPAETFFRISITVTTQPSLNTSDTTLNVVTTVCNIINFKIISRHNIKSVFFVLYLDFI